MTGQLNFSQFVFDINRSRPHNIAYIDQQGTISYHDLETHSCGLAKNFQELGIGNGHRIMIVHPDDRRVVIAFLAALMLGAVPVMVNSRCSREYFNHCVEQSTPSWIISNDSNLTLAQSHCPKQTISSDQLDRLIQPGLFQAVDTHGSSVAYWLFTSGTTGRPRAVMHSHQNLRAVGEHYGVITDGMTSSDVVYATAKLSFAYGICHSLAATLTSGATAILTAKLPMPDTIVSTIQQYHPTIFVTVPTVYSMLINSGLDLGNLGLKHGTSAGEDLSITVQQKWQTITGIPLFNLYGCTEFSGCVLANHHGDSAMGTVGRPTHGYSCELRDCDGNLVPQGTIGELWAKGPSLALGYHDEPDAFLSGWFRSRDLFYQDQQDRYVFQGRSDDMFKVHGQWVSPIEIENVLLERADIIEAGVAGSCTIDGLVEIVAHIVPARGASLSEGDIQSHVRRKLDLHKCPKHIRIVDHLPRTINGKLQRSKLESISI